MATHSINISTEEIQKAVEEYKQRLVNQYVSDLLYRDKKMQQLIKEQASKLIAEALQQCFTISEVSEIIKKEITFEVERRTKAILKNL